MGLNYQINHVPSLGKGSVLLDRFLNGNPTGVFMHLGNCNKFELEPKDDKAELFQSLYPTPTKIAEAVKKRDLKIMIEGTDFSADHSQIYSISSGQTTLSISSGTTTGETLVSAAQSANAKGRYFRTAKPNIDNSTPPVLTQNSVTLVAGTDYVVADLVHGIIYIPLTSTIDVTGAFAITITYHQLATAAAQIAGHTVNFVQGHLLFVPDPADGPNITADVWRVNLTQNGKIGLIADEYGNWTLEGSALDDTANHPSAPFYQFTYL
ncbi:MAG: hypothetical protein ABSE45_15025 [Candidatus Acidiferrales bacterium]|jgi:hypothetical protein